VSAAANDLRRFFRSRARLDNLRVRRACVCPHRSGQSRSGSRTICPPASACGAVLVPSAHDPAPLGQRLITVEGQAAEAAARAGVDPPAVGAGDRVHQLDEARLNRPRSGRSGAALCQLSEHFLGQLGVAPLCSPPPGAARWLRGALGRLPRKAPPESAPRQSRLPHVASMSET
jgi:hypothetical protein